MQGSAQGLRCSLDISGQPFLRGHLYKSKAGLFEEMPVASEGPGPVGPTSTTREKGPKGN